MNIRLKLLFIVLLVGKSFTLSAQTDTCEQKVQGRKNSSEQQQKPYVILISADGFRYDYDKKYDARFLLSMEEKGVHATSMIPSFPSLTFPNHYTLVTGLYPSHHGIVDNDFYDPQRKAFYSMGNAKAVTDGSWYGGTPLWVLAEQQKMVSASMYWVGSEASIKGVLPTYWFHYNEKIGIEDRIQTVVNWLKLPEDTRPHLITFYLPEVDHAGHSHGPESPETRAAVQFVDSAVSKLTDAVKSTGLPVNFIFVSDHGMVRVNNTAPIPLSSVPSDTTKYFINGSGTMAGIYVKDKRYLNEVYDTLRTTAAGYKVYKKDHTPSYWHYSRKDDWKGRIADILLVADAPGYLSKRKTVNPGAHGYDPRVVREMHATFIAWGPAFKENYQLGSFENVHVYPLVAHILGLKVSEKIDGLFKVLKSTLK